MWVMRTSASGVEAAFKVMRDRIRSTHIHDNDGEADKHLFPLIAEGGTSIGRRRWICCGRARTNIL